MRCLQVKFVYMTNIDRRYAMMKRACRELKDEGRLISSCLTLAVSKTEEWNDSWRKELRDADAVLVRWMGGAVQEDFGRKCVQFLKALGIPYFINGNLLPDDSGRGLDPSLVRELLLYAQYGGMDNYRNFWLYLQKAWTGGSEEVTPPTRLPWTGIYYPSMKESFMDDVDEFRRKFWKPGRPALGLLFYRDEWIWKDLDYQKVFVEEAEKAGCNVLPVFTNGSPDKSLGAPSFADVIRKYFKRGEENIVDLVVSALKFSFTTSGGVTREEMESFGLPILQAYTLTTPEEKWRKSPEGMTAQEVSISIANPELDGVIHTIPIAGKETGEDGNVFHKSMKERIRLLVKKAGNMTRLCRLPNEEKKIAVIFHNYPPKNSSIGSAYGLDSMESIRLLLLRLKKEGYTVSSIPESADELARQMTSYGTNDISCLTEDVIRGYQRLSGETYRQQFEKFSPKVQEQMEKDWGEAPGQVMREGKDILVPGIENGNIFITVQPARGFGEDPEKTYHDAFLPPTHQYLAFYQWLRDVWKADAVIHVGTHGNLEWLPGKGAGLDEDSYPELALKDLPNVYIYHMTILGEGTQAKRRSAACLISHMPAPLADSGTYDDLAELERNLDEYAHFKVSGNGQENAVKDLILSKSRELDLDKDVPYEEGMNFDTYAGNLHSYIETIRDTSIHVGLHTLGIQPEGEILTDTIAELLRLPQGDIPALSDLWAEKYGTTPEEMKKKAGEILCGNRTGGELLALVQKETRNLVSSLQKKNFSGEGIEEILRSEEVKQAPDEWKEKLKTLLQFICTDVKDRLDRTREEQDHLIDALSGRFVRAGLSGSPNSTGISILPAGINFYSLDPRTLPTKAAWKLGQRLGEEVISHYIAEEGKYPENIGMIFWAGANMRSHGQCIAEYLWFMGIRPVWETGSGRVVNLVPIPLSELKRPRIDVMGRISGLFRDMVPQAASLMDKAVKLAAGLDEKDEDNFIRKHVKEDAAGLMKEKSMNQEEAWRAAAYRIFGNAPGTYGAGVSNLLEAKNWESLEDLANVYVTWGGNAYGDGYISFQPDLFRKRISQTQITIKNEDNHETSMFSSDDYNAYHGGMIAAVRQLSGKTPHSYAGDSTDRAHPVVATVQETARRVFRAESVNPKFIEGMMKHGYKGAMDLAKRTSISYQWDATSKVMDDWMYEEIAKKYVFDQKVAGWMTKVNPWARERIIETLLEADRRKLWNAKKETKDKLTDLYLEIEGEIEAAGDE